MSWWLRCSLANLRRGRCSEEFHAALLYFYQCPQVLSLYHHLKNEDSLDSIWLSNLLTLEINMIFSFVCCETPEKGQVFRKDTALGYNLEARRAPCHPHIQSCLKLRPLMGGSMTRKQQGLLSRFVGLFFSCLGWYAPEEFQHGRSTVKERGAFLPEQNMHVHSHNSKPTSQHGHLFSPCVPKDSQQLSDISFLYFFPQADRKYPIRLHLSVFSSVTWVSHPAEHLCSELFRRLPCSKESIHNQYKQPRQPLRLHFSSWR